MKSPNTFDCQCYFDEPYPERSEGSGKEKSMYLLAKDFSQDITPLEMTNCRHFQWSVL